RLLIAIQNAEAAEPTVGAWIQGAQPRLTQVVSEVGDASSPLRSDMDRVQKVDTIDVDSGSARLRVEHSPVRPDHLAAKGRTPGRDEPQVLCGLCLDGRHKCESRDSDERYEQLTGESHSVPPEGFSVATRHSAHSCYKMFKRTQSSRYR